MCFSNLGVFLNLVKPLSTENTENKTTPKICKITVGAFFFKFTWQAKLYSCMLIIQPEMVFIRMRFSSLCMFGAIRSLKRWLAVCVHQARPYAATPPLSKVMPWTLVKAMVYTALCGLWSKQWCTLHFADCVNRDSEVHSLYLPESGPSRAQ